MLDDFAALDEGEESRQQEVRKVTEYRMDFYKSLKTYTQTIIYLHEKRRSFFGGFGQNRQGKE